MNLAVPHLFAQIKGGRIQCQNEATLQLHLGRIIATAADLALVGERETFSIELEKPHQWNDGQKGRIDIWFRLVDAEGTNWRCAPELKYFKKVNHREPNNRKDVFLDIARLERSGEVADLAYMLVATDHSHYFAHDGYSDNTGDFDLRHGRRYQAGTVLTYRTGGYGGPVTLASDYSFVWDEGGGALRYLLVEVAPA